MEFSRCRKHIYIVSIVILSICAVLFFKENVIAINGSAVDDLRILMDNVREQRALIEEVSCKLIGIGARGGFCLSEKAMSVGGNAVSDYQLAKLLEEKLFRGSTIGDFGAGLGWYGRYWTRNTNLIFANASAFEKDNFFQNGIVKAALETPKIIKSWEGFDGAGNVGSLTNGFVKFLDLSQPQILPKKYDWVISIEVGEHIPKEFEKVFIDNLDKHACKGIVLSWAVEGQGGHHHVNLRNNNYIKDQMAKRNFINKLDLEKEFRAAIVVSWLKNTLMVFERKDVLKDPKCNN